MCPKGYGLRKKLPTLMTIRRVNGVRSAPQKKRMYEHVSSLSGCRQKSPSALAAEPLRAEHMCSRSAFCRCATFETAPCDGSERPACARKRLRPLARDATAPTI